MYIYTCIDHTLYVYMCIPVHICRYIYTRIHILLSDVAYACVYMTHICKWIRKRIEGRPEKKMKKENTKSSKTSTSHRFKSVL